MKLLGMAAENGNAALRIPNMAGGVSYTNSWCLVTLEGHQVKAAFALFTLPAAEVSFLADYHNLTRKRGVAAA